MKPTFEASTAPFTHPDRYTRGTDAAMYTTLGLPVPSERCNCPLAEDYGMTDTEWYGLHPEDDQDSFDCAELNWLNDEAEAE